MQKEGDVGGSPESEARENPVKQSGSCFVMRFQLRQVCFCLLHQGCRSPCSEPQQGELFPPSACLFCPAADHAGVESLQKPVATEHSLFALDETEEKEFDFSERKEKVKVLLLVNDVFFFRAPPNG